jgi:SMODS and SLOG-associating 2TM effector domain family 4
MSDDKTRELILATARELYGRAVWTHKVHEKEREIWSTKACSMNRWGIGLACVTTILAVVSVALQPKIILILTAVSAAASTGFALWQSNFDPVGKENKHRTMAKGLLCVRESLFLLIVRCHISEEAIERLRQSLDGITRELTMTYKFAPDTSSEAYALAGKSLKDGEFTFSDDEIDSLLPTKFRKSVAANA